MLAVCAAAACWVATSGRPTGAGSPVPIRAVPFHAGLIDLACTGLLAVVLPVAGQAARLARRELRLARSAA